MSADVSPEENSPLALELGSLRRAVEHFQSEAHRSNVQLQYLSLQHKDARQKWNSFERERDALLREVNILRETSSLAGAHRDALQLQELTLSLRRLSDKLDLADESLLKRTQELIMAQTEKNVAKRLEIAAYEHLDSLKMALERRNIEKRDLLERLRAEEHQRKMSDLVVEEYADLVRSLESRRTTEGRASRASVDGLQNARRGLEKLLNDSNADSEKLHAEIAHLHEALEKAQMQLEAERNVANDLRHDLAENHLLLQKLERDDKAAAKMVSRYMKFSQSSTNVLHDAIASLKSRQEALVSTYETRLTEIENNSASERRHHGQLQRAFEELTEDISREAYGRRREVTLRLSFLAREEALSERLRRWILRTKESRTSSGSSEEFIEKVLTGADEILLSLNGPAKPVDEDSHGSLTRILAAEAAVRALQYELQRETDLRLYCERQLFLNVPSNPSKPSISKSPGSEPLFTRLPIPPQSLERSSMSAPDNDVPTASNPAGDSNVVASLENATSVTTVGAPEAAVIEERSDVSITPSDAELKAFETQDVSGILPSVTFASEEVSIDAAGPSLISARQTLSEVSVEGIVLGPLLRKVSAENFEGLDEYREEMGPCKPIADDLQIQQIETGTKVEISHVNGVGADFSIEEHLTMEQDDRHKDGESEINARVCTPLLVVDEEVDSNHAMGPSARFTDVVGRLSVAQERYASLQKSFRDCYLSLRQLKATLFESSHLKDMLPSIIERLSDHCEDARVELEIRIGDEERISKGYETLLLVPGALSGELDEQDVLPQVEAFIDGTDPAVARAVDSLRQKLEDLLHDIAVVKRAMSDASPLLATQEIQPSAEEKPKQSGWSAWAGSILAPSRSASPAPSFGAVMTSPRLRSSPSSSSLRHDSATADPIAGLGLRIPMPSGITHHNDSSQASSLFMQRGGSRPRVASNMLGLGFKGVLPGARVPSNYSHDSLPQPALAASTVDPDDDVE